MNGRSSAKPQLVLPDDFDANEWEVRAKGYYVDAVVRVDGQEVAVAFYDPARLQQDVEAELSSGFVVLPAHTVVLGEVTRKNMEAFVASHYVRSIHGLWATS